MIYFREHLHVRGAWQAHSSMQSSQSDLNRRKRGSRIGSSGSGARVYMRDADTMQRSYPRQLPPDYWAKGSWIGPVREDG